MKFLKLVLTVLCLSGAACAFAEGPLVLHYQIGRHKAQLEGNLSPLEKASKNAKYEEQRRVAHLAYLQSQMRLSDLLRESKACFQSKMIRGKTPVLAISCSMYAAEAAYYDQHIAEYARLILAAKHYDLPELKKLTGKSYKIAFFYHVDAKAFTNVPRATVKRSKKADFLPWVQCGPHHLGNMAKVWLQVNHEKVCFVIDTGTSISQLTQKTAQKLRLTAYKGKYGFGLSKIKGKTKIRYGRLAVVKHVKIGHDVLNDMPFMISKDIVNILGTDAQRKLGRLLFTRAGLYIRPVSKSSCSEPMAYAYHYGFALGPMVNLVVNGTLRRLMFDSGQTSALFTNARKFIGSTKTSEMKPSYAIGQYGQTQKAYVTEATVARTPKSKSFTVVPLEYGPNYYGLVPLRAGFGLLKKYNVELDFDAHTACFLPAG